MPAEPARRPALPRAPRRDPAPVTAAPTGDGDAPGATPRPGAPRPAPPAREPAPRLVPAVERATRVLDLLAASRRPMPLADLARATGLPRSSLHGLLATLVELDLARRDEDVAFSLGPRALRWADAYGAQSDVLRAFETRADRVPALATETVMLATLEGADVVYLACRTGSRPLAVNFRVGGRFPASATSSGKAMLATLPDDAVRARLGRGPLPKLTRHGVSSVAALIRQLDGFRASGVAVDDEETAEGMQCFGAPVFGARGPEALAAVAVSVIKAGLTARRRGELVDAIGSLAHAMSTDLGARPD